jgi:hypothetical protein
VFARPPVPRREPIQRQVVRAQRRTRAAQRRLPQRPLPYVPIIRQPTPRQTRAAKRIITGAIRRAVGPGGSGADRLERRRLIEQELRSTAPGYQLLRAARHYARWEQRHTEMAAGLAALRVSPSAPVREGVRRGPLPGFDMAPRGLTKTEVRAIGRDVIAGRLARDRVAPGVRKSLQARGLATVLAQTSLGSSPSGARRFAGNIAKDVGALATGPFVGGYELGAGAVEALSGRGTSRLQRLGAGVAQGISHSAPGELLLHGDPGAAGRQFLEHPVLTGLDFAAGLGTVGRTAGALARAGGKVGAPGVRGRLAEIGSTVRSPIAESLDPAVVRQGAYRQRSGSKDLFRKGFQGIADRGHDFLRDQKGNIVHVHDRGRMVPVLKPLHDAPLPGGMEHLQRGDANFRASGTNARERYDREIAGRLAKVRGRLRRNGIRDRVAQDIVMLAASGAIRTAKTFEKDLRGELDRLRAEHERSMADASYRHSGVRALVERNIELLDKALHSPRVMAQKERIVAEGERLGRQLNEGDAALLRAKVLDSPEQAKRRRLLEVAISHAGARHVTVEEHARLERAATTGEERIAVSGRPPEKLRAHEHWKGEEDTRGRAVKEAAKEHERLWRRRRDVLAVQRSRLARAQKGSKAAKRQWQQGRRELEKLDADLTAARATLKARRDAHREAQAKLKRHPLPKAQAGLRTQEGRYLPDEDIERHLTSVGRDPRSVAYLPHRQDVLGARAFHRRAKPGVRPMVPPERATGEAHRKGARMISREMLQQAGVRQATLLNQASRQDRLVRELGGRHPAWAKAQRGETLTKDEERIVRQGGYFTGPEALEFAERLEHDTSGRPQLDFTASGYPVLRAPSGERVVPMRAFGARLSEEAQHVIREQHQGPAGMDSLAQRLLNDRVASPEELRSGKARNIVLMPAGVVEQLERHLKPASEFEKFFQALNAPFRFAVLAQPRWLTGNFMEPYIIRMTTTGSGINVFGLARDLTATRRLLKRMEGSQDPRVRDAAAQIRAQQFGGLFVGNRSASVYRTAEQDFPVLYGKIISRLPVIREGFDFMRAVGRMFMKPGNAFFRANRVIEGLAQRGVLGQRVARDIQDMQGSVLAGWRLHKDALDEVARGLVDTPTQRRFMEVQHEILGKYEGFPPWGRRLVQTIMPFIPWVLNSARFVFWTMPAHRTVQTALLMKVNDVVAQDWKDQHADTPPGSLRLAIPTKKGGWIDLARYTPYGMSGPLASGDLQGVTDQLLPQFSGTLSAIEGRDPFGRPLRTEAQVREGRKDVTGGEKLFQALYGLGESLVPYIAQIRRVREGGGTAYSGSTALDPDVKPGTDYMSGWRRTFDPFRPTYLRSPSSGGKVKSLGTASSGLDDADLHDLREAVGGSSGLDDADLQELRDLVRGR